MRWHDVSIDGEWDVPQGKREKGVGGSLVLPELAHRDHPLASEVRL